MTRDMDLIRTLMLKVEALQIPPGAKLFIPYYDDWFQVDGYPSDQVVDNLRLLHNGGLIDGSGPTNSDFGIVGLSWEGAEFLDAIRNPEVWTKTRAAMKKVGGIGLELAAQMAKAYGKQLLTEKLGIPLS